MEIFFLEFRREMEEVFVSAGEGGGGGGLLVCE